MVFKLLALMVGSAVAAHVPLRTVGDPPAPLELNSNSAQQLQHPPQHQHTADFDNLQRILPPVAATDDIERRLAANAAAPVAETPVCSADMVWSSEQGRIMLNGEPFQLKGINWSGFETEQSVPDGMWPDANNMNNILGQMRVLGFNALRIPLSLDLALAPKTIVPLTGCEACGGQLSWKVLDDLFDLAAAYGILILLDMHRLNKINQSNLWYDEDHTPADFTKGWVAILTKFGGKANLLGIDVKNEPTGEATWGAGDPTTDWNTAAESIVKGIVAKVPTYNKLIFVEGIATDFTKPQPPANAMTVTDEAFFKFAGQNLDGVKTNPIDFGDPALNKLLVYSPHVYGPDVATQPYFTAATFPKNMAAIWDLQMGFLKQATGSAVVTGEWGGNFVGDDLMWATAWTNYMVDKCFSDNFFWVINPNSGDTGGLLAEDWTTVVPLKAALMKKVQPNPSAFTTAITPRGACLNYGKPVCPFVPAATAAAGL